jgi:hypothetical protein
MATMQSDTDPLGTAQLGAPINNMWEPSIPKVTPTTTCKAIGYAQKSLTRSGAIQNNMTHPLATLNSLVVDVTTQDAITMQIINIYHAVPLTGHNLCFLFSHELDELTPTILIGDFNTHSPLWSLPGCTPLSWGGDLEEWADHNGLKVLNPHRVVTWVGSKESDHPSILNLAFANEAAHFTNQLSSMKVSLSDSLGSDHATLSFQVYPLDHLTLQPPPAPTGYKPDPERRDAWMKEFARLMPYTPTYTLMEGAPSDQSHSGVSA